MRQEDYNALKIEKKWQDKWDKLNIFAAGNDLSKPKYYALVEFPYPSGTGLHIGHPRPYTALDIIARKRRMEGYNVLFPMGWDAFGLPTENYAIKNRIHPKKVTQDNIRKFKRQLKSLGFSYDWGREVNTTDPAYYRWTQWIFLKLFEQGLAYKAKMPINWCTECKVGLANEEVVDGVCERCGGEVDHRVKSQWMLKITEYAQKLLDGLDTVDYPERVKASQRNWIGRSEGAEVDFMIAGGGGAELKVFTTRPDTLFGATYMVVSPEHPLIDDFADRIENIGEVRKYRADAAKKSDFERSEISKEKTGVELKGLQAMNPVNGENISIWISDYILMTYGTGAIMAVPGHDTRDWEFARKFNLPIVEVISGGDIEKEAFVEIETGTMVNSGFLNGKIPSAAITDMIAWLESEGLGKAKVNFKLRDWVFSRQRYWGEPIPLVYCEKCGWVPIPEDELPLKLPEVADYMPTDTGESPLANMADWVNTTCPKCGGPGKRETDTMPQWAGSSWYFLRYTDPDNDKQFASPEMLKYWMPVDWYNGGMEHTTLHLLYSRFWHRFLFDQGYVNTPEPYKKRTSHGMILGENNEKMSKSRGNTVSPDIIVDAFGADTLRTYEMFIGAFEQAASWSNDGVKGSRKFLDRVWKLKDMMSEDKGYSPALEIKIHKTIKKVGLDFEKLKFNTAIASMMELVNDFYSAGRITRADYETLLTLLNPVAPHITEELFEIIEAGKMVCASKWPEFNPAKTVDDIVEIGVQINGKLRGTVEVGGNDTADEVCVRVMADDATAKYFTGFEVVKLIYVPKKIFNAILKEKK